ncbi:hypothetical protein B0H63DRAFT_140415 [Podospora didyma]|uniref:AAA+ ATPase domain-containing protein n=1 Tax=Podospora didyma TaxID=330526 RepID=A0AAE0NS85_9PEZI|nr:hypothetical protein B0H63DRAFT_140415 [Podospora didyma]
MSPIFQDYPTQLLMLLRGRHEKMGLHTESTEPQAAAAPGECVQNLNHPAALYGKSCERREPKQERRESAQRKLRDPVALAEEFVPRRRQPETQIPNDAEHGPADDSTRQPPPRVTECEDDDGSSQFDLCDNTSDHSESVMFRPTIGGSGKDMPSQSKRHFIVIHIVFCCIKNARAYKEYQLKYTTDLSRCKPLPSDYSFFMDSPAVCDNNHLAGKIRVANFEDAMVDHPNISFVVFRHHLCSCMSGRMAWIPKANWPFDTLQPLCERLRDDFRNLATFNPMDPEDWPFGRPEDSPFGRPSYVNHLRRLAARSGWDHPILVDPEPNLSPSASLSADPKLIPTNWTGASYGIRFLYHHSEELFNLLLDSPDYRENLHNIVTFLDKDATFAEEFRKCQRAFDDGWVSEEKLKYLFCENSVVVSRSQQARRETWLAYVVSKPASASAHRINASTYTLDTWKWEFDGNSLTRQHVPFTISVPRGGRARIADLAVFPLKYAPNSEDLGRQLLDRGKMFWGLRFQSHVAYEGLGWDREIIYPPESRFMVDCDTYHPTLVPNWRLAMPEVSSQATTSNARGFDKWPTIIPRTEEDLGESAMFLPADIMAYCLNGKESLGPTLTSSASAVQLHVEGIRPVTWNKNAYGNIFFPEPSNLTDYQVSFRASKTRKEFAKKLVLGWARREKALTEAQRRRQGPLVMHFYGPAGSGKTSLAKALAELAELPLYHVKKGEHTRSTWAPDDAFRVMHQAGHAWRCMLLLDEVDGWVESKDDCRTEATLLSRLLATYPGIVILTSRCSSTPIISSRIHLTVACTYTCQKVRAEIWRRELRGLRARGEMSEATLSQFEKTQFQSLAHHVVNGHVISNVLAIVSQLAEFEGEQVTADHLSDALFIVLRPVDIR